uniref:Uncharacterized protein n=1 Tax=Timema poppense TaxID=170557 RepID=A0A7R9D6X6_TIMPO|nr:unnamed protein product [Timema poppensis]
MCLKANIPINKLDHPAVREYLKKKIKSAYVRFLQEEHADLPAILFPSPVVTRWNSWFHSVLYLNDYSDALIEFLGQYENNNASAEYLLEQQRDPVAWQSVKRQMVFIADSCKMFVELINKLEGSKFPFAHLLWHELEALMSVLKRLPNRNFSARTLSLLGSITSVAKREELKQLLCGCAQKSAMKLAKHMAPCTTNNFFKAAGELFNPAIAAQSLTPDEKSAKKQFEVIPLFSKLTSYKCVEGYLYLHKVMGTTVREGKVCDIIQMLMAMKVTNSAFAGPALQTIWAPVNSVDAERFFSHASDVVFDCCAHVHIGGGGEDGETASPRSLEGLMLPGSSQLHEIVGTGAGNVIDNKVADMRGQNGRQPTYRHEETTWTK